MKSSKMNKERNASKKVGNHWYSLFQHSAGAQKAGRALEPRLKVWSKKKKKRTTLSLRYKMAARQIFSPAESVLHDVVWLWQAAALF